MDAIVSEMKKRFTKTMEVLKSDSDNSEKAKEASELSDWLKELDIESADLFIKTIKNDISRQAKGQSIDIEHDDEDKEIDEAKIIEDYKMELAIIGSKADGLHDYIRNALVCIEMWTKDRSKAENMSEEEKVRFFLDIPEDTEIGHYRFEFLNAKDLQALVEHNLILLDGSHNEGPTVKELYEFSKKNPLFLYSGNIYEIEKGRWLTVDNVYLPHCLSNLSAMNDDDYIQMKKDFFMLGVTSDAFHFGIDITAWWD